MPIPLEVAEKTLQSTLQKYMDTEGAPIDETMSRTIGCTGMLLSGASLKTHKGGREIKHKVKLSRNEMGRWVGLLEKVNAVQSTAPVWTTAYMRIYHSVGITAEEELEAQGDKDVVLDDIQKEFVSDMRKDMIDAIDDAVQAADGNYLHDGSSNYLAMFGWRHLITDHGLHITGDPTLSVLGINPSTYAAWRNEYINPYAASDGGAVMSSVLDVRKALDRAIYRISYQGLGSYGKLAQGARGVPDGQNTISKKGSSADELFIMADPALCFEQADVAFDKQDNVTDDQFTGLPRHKGCTIHPNERMGLGTSGYGYDQDGNQLWSYEPTGYTLGQWASAHEIAVIRKQHLLFTPHEKFNPRLYKVYKPEGVLGVAAEAAFWGQLGCNSRRRLACKILCPRTT